MFKERNIELRAPEPSDLDVLFKIENDTALWHLSNTLTPFSRFDLEQFILSNDKDIYNIKQARFIIDHIENGERNVIGAIDLFDFNPYHSRAGIGVVILEKYRKKGHAGRALDLLIRYSFDHLGLHQLYCNIEEENLVSLKLFRSKGFVVCGEKLEWNKKGRSWNNEYMLQLLKKE